METLAFLHLALAYEDPNPSPNLRFKDTDLRAASSVAISFIASGIVASTLTCADVAQATLYYGSRGSDVAKLQEALGNIAVDGVFGSETLARLKSYQAKKGLMVDGIAGAETLSSLGWSSLSRNSKSQDVGIGKVWSEPEQYGRLQLINDTPYMALVLLYKPGNEKPSRYAYISPCSKRTLGAIYSGSWKISSNQSEKFSIAEKADKKEDFFEVKLSNLKKDYTQLCEFNNKQEPKAKPIYIPPSIGRTRREVRENAETWVDEVTAQAALAKIQYEKAVGESEEKERLSDYYNLLEKQDSEVDYGLGVLMKSDESPDNGVYTYMGMRLRIKAFRGELNPNKPEEIYQTLSKWYRDPNCQNLFGFSQFQNLEKRDITVMQLILLESMKRSQGATDSLDKATIDSFRNQTVRSDFRKSNCELAGNRHPIYANFGNQSQRTLRSCKN